MRLSSYLSTMVLLLCGGASARAEQFVLVDASYTHSTETTSDSHYYPDIPADVPGDFTQPVDYANGFVHLELDVSSKPEGDAPTKLQVCFETPVNYACTLQSPTYTTTGHVEWDSTFDSFWYSGDVDWSNGILKMPLILKDDQNNKPHGDPRYMPTDLHVLVVLVSAGEQYVPNTDGGVAGSDASTGDAGASAPVAGAGGLAGGSGGAGAGATGVAGIAASAAGASGIAPTGAGSAATSGAIAPAMAAGESAAAADSYADAGVLAPTAPTTAESAAPSGQASGCSATGAAPGGMVGWLGIASWLGLRRRFALL